MSEPIKFPRVAALKTPAEFRAHVESLGIEVEERIEAQAAHVVAGQGLAHHAGATDADVIRRSH